MGENPSIQSTLDAVAWLPRSASRSSIVIQGERHTTFVRGIDTRVRKPRRLSCDVFDRSVEILIRDGLHWESRAEVTHLTRDDEAADRQARTETQRVQRVDLV